MDVEEKLLAFLPVSAERIRHHARIIWEVQKHYSWWAYVILGGVVYLYQTDWTPTVLVLLNVSSVFGFLMCCIAFRVQRREGEQLHYALADYRDTLVALDLPDNVYDTVGLRSHGKPNRPLLRVLLFTLFGERSGRDHFQLGSLLLAGLFAASFFFVFPYGVYRVVRYVVELWLAK